MTGSTTLIAAAFALTAGPATAEIVGDNYRYEVGDGTFEGYVARNPDIQPRGTVLIVHDWDGLTKYERRRAEMLAAHGYTAFAVDVYGADTNPQSTEEYQELSGALYDDRDTFRERLLGSVEAAAEIPGGTDNMVMMGYCFGGQAVLQAARAGADLDGFVTFHAGLGVPEGQDYSDAQGPIKLFHGSSDPVSSMETFAAEIEAMKAAGVEHEAEVYGGARHAFTVFESDDYDLEADTASWAALQRFLSANL